MQKTETTELKKRSWPRRILRIFLKTVLFIFLFILLVFLLILTPPVQRFLTVRVQNYLEKKLQTKVSIGRIGFGLSGNIALKDVYIEDKTKDTLVSGGALKAHLDFMKLFSNEVNVKDIELQNITAKIKRVLPDTVFNYQFIVNAFAGEENKAPDTAQSAPMKLNISDVTLDNVALTFTDAVTGSDVYAHIGYATTTIDTLDPATQHFTFPSLILRNSVMRMKQNKPLLEPKPLTADVQQAAAPSPMKLNFGVIDVSKVAVQYDDDVSALYSNINIGKLKVDGKLLDLQHNKIYLDEISLGNTTAAVRMGKQPGVQVTKQEASQKAEAQKQAGWDFRVDKIRFDNANVRLDDDSKPQLSYGMDYSHVKFDSITLYADRFVMNDDSTAVAITKGSLKEKSGFRLNELHGDVLYASNQTAINNLLIKTPGSEIKRSAVLKYASLDEFAKHFERTVMDIQIVNSYAQVKDILLFAPQLRSQPAFRNPNDVWKFNIVTRGTMDRLTIESLQFDGLQNTHLNASGTLLGLSNPNNAGGNFTIYRFHSNQNDMALFMGGQRLSNSAVDLPESFDVSGLINGNAGRLNTTLNVNTTDGNINLQGSFANLLNPAATSYNATVRTSNLRLGKILRQQDQIGTLTGSFSANGHGITPNAINTKFNANINNVGYNHYAYRNIKVNGSLQKTVFTINADVADPNIDVTLNASGDYAAKGDYKFDAIIDSVKAQNLHFSDSTLDFRGNINGTVSNLMADNMTADVSLTKALVVTPTNRLTLDSIQVLAGYDNENYITLKSQLATAELRGQYKLADLGNIIMNNIQPYFATATNTKPAPPVQPYNIRFKADLIYSPTLAALVPDLKRADNVHLEGSLATGQGLNALITAPTLVYQTNEIHGLQAKVNTDATGMHINTTLDRLKAGGLDVYATRLNATAMNNNINFSVGIDDKAKKQKYLLGGSLAMAANGDMTLHLNPDSLRLNYDTWAASPNNSIVVGKAITANNFILSKGNQQLSIQSLGSGDNQPLQVKFTSFRIATLSSFMSADSVMVDGVINGAATFTNLTQTPLFTSDLTVTDFNFRKDTLGNINLKVSSTTANAYNTNITLTGGGNDLAITGNVTQTANDIAMNLDLAIRKMLLDKFQGALKDFITAASGSINGNVALRGTASAPKIDGKLNFDNVAISTLALGGPLRVDKESLVAVSNKGFEFKQFTIRDSANQPFTIDGLVGTTNFINYNFDLNLRAKNFTAINIPKTQKGIYYGKLLINTNMHITGTETAPKVDGNLTVDDGTDFTVVMPEQDPGIVSREGVVQFVDFSNPAFDSLFLKPYDSLRKSVLVGYDIGINLTIKKEAKFSIIVDPANGDFVNLQGEALLSAGVDPSGKTTLTGSYEIDKGSYQLSYNFIQRKFDIQKGSRVVWMGDPLTAQLDVHAIYIANTAPLDLVSNYISASNQAIRNTYLQKLPFQVFLNLKGDLMKPDISFDIQLPTNKSYNVSSDIISNVDIRLAQLRQESSELNKQVFALLLLGRFVGENPFQSSEGGGGGINSYARQSVSKLLTEQLNNLTQSLVGGVDINFDVTSSDDYTTGERRDRTDLNVGVSKQLLNNRLTVTVGSNFELEGPQQQGGNQQKNNLAGNIALNYMLSRDGRYMLRFFRRNESYGVEGYVIETGIRFIITLDYDRFANLFRRKKLRVENNDSKDNKDNQNQSLQ